MNYSAVLLLIATAAAFITIGITPSSAAQIDLYTKSYYLNCGTLSSCQQFDYPWTYRGKYVENQVYDFNLVDNGGYFCYGKLSFKSINQTHYRFAIQANGFDPARNCDLRKQPAAGNQCAACFSALPACWNGSCTPGERKCCTFALNPQ